jgi:hypothetical protein
VRVCSLHTFVPVPTGTTTEDAFNNGGSDGEFQKVRARVFAVFVADPPQHKVHLHNSCNRRNARGSKEDRTCMIEGRDGVVRGRVSNVVVNENR